MRNSFLIILAALFLTAASFTGVMAEDTEPADPSRLLLLASDSYLKGLEMEKESPGSGRERTA